MDGESVPDHMYRMAMLALTIPELPEGVDRNDAIKMCLVHDLAEAIVGDITPDCGISSERKREMEAKAMNDITGLLSTEEGKQLQSLYFEYESGKTATAKFVKDLDKLEFLLQAKSYEARYNKDFKDFYNNTIGKINNKSLLSLFKFQ